MRLILHHKGLTQEHWNTLSLMEQLANVGCDVSRTIRWRNRNNVNYSTAGLERALELLDLTIADPKHKGRRKELVRVREVLKDYFLGDNEYGSTDELWEKYFYAYNWAAALEKGR
ncbi:hypothetical protein FJ364_05900 [Candidatus Dependentiae bacterium]|nr:hypothetical protein [Candidatus Dependentiae bacterium]